MEWESFTSAKNKRYKIINNMLIVDDVLVSDDLANVKFCCNLKQCKGVCCIEGDAGAPLEAEEISVLEENIEKIKPYMVAKGIKEVETNGVYAFDSTGAMVTPLVNDKECVYVYFEGGIAKCAIEKAYKLKKIKFQKPISCHLYPIRLTKRKGFNAINYHQWEICKGALAEGRKGNIILYQFLEEAIIRKYGKRWYNGLVKAIRDLKKSKG